MVSVVGSKLFLGSLTHVPQFFNFRLLFRGALEKMRPPATPRTRWSQRKYHSVANDLMHRSVDYTSRLMLWTFFASKYVDVPDNLRSVISLRAGIVFVLYVRVRVLHQSVVQLVTPMSHSH